ncbi:Bacterial extracellular solute-binding protein, family 3 [compost metagenome]
MAALIARNPQSPIELKFKIKTSPAYIGVSKGERRFLDHINKFITVRKQNGELDSLYKKWFGMPLPELPQS